MIGKNNSLNIWSGCLVGVRQRNGCFFINEQLAMRNDMVIQKHHTFVKNEG